MRFFQVDQRWRGGFLVLALAVRLVADPEPAALGGEATGGLNPGKLAEIDAAFTQALAEGRMPGAVLWLEHQGTSYHRAYGRMAVDPRPEAMREDTVFDLASLTKVVATTPAVMLLVERGKLELDERVRTYIPEFKTDGKGAITIRQLLTHTSGLRPDVSTRPPWEGYETAIALACEEKLESVPGTAFRYSDINFFLLGDVVRRVAGRGLDQFVVEEVYRPLKMFETGFRPSTNQHSMIAPTQRIDGRMLRGTVHDPTARYMGGVAGHAGLFSTAADLARYARMLLNSGELEGARIFRPETVRLMTTVQSPATVEPRRGLGWDIDSGYSRPRGKLFPLGSYGHTGFTGTALWLDPFSKTFWILLSNRVHPDGKGNVLPLQATVGTLAAEVVQGFDFARVKGELSPRRPRSRDEASGLSTVLTGIDMLARERYARLKDLRVGLITNHTGVNRQRHSTIDLFNNAVEVDLRALFSPEHGIRGVRDERVDDSRDEKTGLPVYSLYGVSRAPAPEQLKDLDALVFDIQEIGCRFYTYIATLGNCLEAAAKARIKFFVLDRVNPINGISVEGPVYAGESRFIAYHSVPLRHGMTVGELARMFNEENHWQADLTVIPVRGWSRRLWFDETAQPWINPSPNMRSLAQATLYPGVGLHETALSVGRGTDTPFEVIGAPYIDDVQLATELNQAKLDGVRFVPIRFTPAASVYQGQACGGVNLIVTDRDHFRPVDVGIVIGLVLHRLYPDAYPVEKLDTLLRDAATLDLITAGKSLTQIRAEWEPALDDFRKRREKYLLYR